MKLSNFFNWHIQVRADHIQSDLDELVKALNERCKKYGLYVKPTTLVELPFGNFISCWPPMCFPFLLIRQIRDHKHLFKLSSGMHLAVCHIYIYILNR